MPGRSSLAKIHIAAHELGLEDKAYRRLLRRRYRKDSAAQLSEAEAADLVGYFRGLGWRPRSRQGGASEGQIRLLYALWHRLEESGAVYPGTAGLKAFIRHRSGRSSAGSLTAAEASSLIESLKQWLARVVEEA